MCGWSANLESKLLAVFCSLRRLLLGTLLFEISFNWLEISALHKGGIHLHNANSLDVACRYFDVAWHFRCGVRHFEVSFHRLLFFFFFFAKKIFATCVSVCLVVSEYCCLWELGCI